ncbi:spindle assembly checkpoint component [Arabidopsis thaliana]|uniref:Spindle assembly checkpoint component n=1 Tax=Arabidopsis thaliana TaxID=3702 RepID=F4IZ28_ARATH|nr:spindle assembly checkpoint component [Arabidopsis thaliana]AEE77438.1 spindle assembly checkpoint component [Arabidopsis thaliana]|eukprot:NP_189478.2 spindle assembly checkpoint component [Arabidopsis thaliana]
MAGIDTQKQLLSLIRDFTSERSRGEQRVVGLKKRIEILQSEVEAANSEVEKAKRIKEVAEEELNGYEVELSLNDATIQSLEARISLLQDEVTTIGSEVDALKNKEGLLRDQFISQMEELNKEIREFQKTVDSSLSSDDGIGITANVKASEDGSGADLEAIKGMLSEVNSQLAKEEEGYLAEQKIQEQLQKELDDYEKKMSLMEAITDKTNSVQVLTRYPLILLADIGFTWGGAAKEMPMPTLRGGKFGSPELTSSGRSRYGGVLVKSRSHLWLLGKRLIYSGLKMDLRNILV